MHTSFLAAWLSSNIHTAFPPGDKRLKLFVDPLQQVMVEGAGVEEGAHHCRTNNVVYIRNYISRRLNHHIVDQCQFTHLNISGVFM